MHAHDPSLCITEAEAVCRKAGESLTPLRRRVLELLLDAPGPAKAYDLLARLGDESGPAKPPTIYRALEFLREYGLVHRINSLNAFIGCQHPQDRHHSYFLICRRCESTVELASDALASAVHAAASDARFQAEGASIEITGLCPSCQS